MLLVWGDQSRRTPDRHRVSVGTINPRAMKNVSLYRQQTQAASAGKHPPGKDISRIRYVQIPATGRHAHRIHPHGIASNPPRSEQDPDRSRSPPLSRETISPGKSPPGVWHQPSVESPFRCILTRIFNRPRLPGCAHRPRSRSTNPIGWCLRRGEIRRVEYSPRGGGTALQAGGDDSPTSCPTFAGETMPFLTARFMPIDS